MNEFESEITDLQSRTAFQEDALSALNDIVAKQNLEIQQLQAQMHVLYRRIDELKYELEQGDNSADSPPPHY